jgi:hypothetical protein
MCRTCEKSLAQNVAQGEALVIDLRVTAEKLDRTGKPGPTGTGSKTPPLPVRLDASKLAASLERHLAANSAGTDAERAARAATADWGPSWHARLEGLIVKAVAKVDLPPEWIRLGACGSMWESEDGPLPCENELAVPAGAYEVTCEVCGSWYDVAERQAAKIASAWDAIATPPVIVRALATQGVRLEVKHIENWAQLGHLGRLCDLVTGAEGYRIGEVHAVALRMAERRRNAAARRERPQSRETANI